MFHILRFIKDNELHFRWHKSERSRYKINRENIFITLYYFKSEQMAYNEKLTNRLRKALSHVPQTEEKKMFRGIAFIVGEKLCISAGDDEIMCRVNPLLHDQLVIKDGCRAVVMRGREYKGYVYVKERVIPRKKELDFWIKLALEFNKVAKSSRKNKKK